MIVQPYKESLHKKLLDDFCRDVNVENNADIKSLGIANKLNAMMFLIIDDDKIVNMCYAHDFSDYYKGAWRVFTRTATLPDWRGKGFPFQRSMVMAAGLAAFSLPYQIKYAQSNGASKILFTTNSNDGMLSSQKLDRYLTKIEASDPRFSFIERREIYGCEQSVWKLHYSDIINLTGQLPHNL